MIKSILSTCFAVVAILGLFATGLLINVAQFLGFLLYPISPFLPQRVSARLAEANWGAYVRFFGKYAVVRNHFHGDSLRRGESSFMISDHKSWTDWVVATELCRRAHTLSYLTYFAKDSLKYIPFFGYGTKLLGLIFVKRNWEKDKKAVAKVFDFFRRSPNPVCVFCFLEGSRLVPKKLKQSQEFAKKLGYPEFSYHLTPRPKGFLATLRGLEGKLESIYDLTIAYDENGTRIPSIWDMIRMCVDADIHTYVRRIPIEALPESDEDRVRWCWKLFWEKDEILKFFYNKKRFPSEKELESILSACPQEFRV